MKDFIKNSKILLKRNSLWLILLTLLVLLVNTISVRNQIGQFTDEISYQTGRLEWIYQNKDQIFGELEDNTDEYYYSMYVESTDFVEINMRRLEEKKNLDKFFSEYNEKYKELLDYFNVTREELVEVEWYNVSSVDNLENTRANFLNELKYYEETMYLRLNYNIETNSFNMSEKIATPTMLFYFVIILVGMLLTSVDHFTSYYEFTRLLPWSRGKGYVMKLAFGAIFILVVYLISLGINYGGWMNSNYVSEFVTNGITINFLKRLMEYISLLIITISLGEISGNVFGHGGLLIIVFSGLELIEYNILLIIDMFTNIFENEIVGQFNSFIENNDILNTIYIPINGLVDNNNTELFTFFGIGLVFLGLGYYWVRHSKAERSGMLIQNKYISKYAQILAIISTANIVSAIFGMTLGGYEFILRIGIFIVALILSYKFYKLLFKVRIGV